MGEPGWQPLGNRRPSFLNFQVPNNNLGHLLNFTDPRALPLTLYQHLQESDAGQALYLFLLLLLLLLLLFFMPRLVWEMLDWYDQWEP